MTFTDYIFEDSKLLKKTAIFYNGEVEYEKLFHGICNVETIILKNKISKGESIVLISDNSTFFVESYFGIIKSGVTCIPINPSISDEDIQYIFDVCNVKTVFVQKKYIKRIKNFTGEQINIYCENSIEDINVDVLDLKKASVAIDVNSDIAVILFTSGSTAKPKGVMLTHYNLMCNTNSIIEYLKLEAKDRVEVVLPFYYCYGTSLLHTHLKVGGSMVINNKFMFPATVIEDIIKYQCTGFAGVPSNFQILLRKTNIKNYTFPSLRYITQAGGKLSNAFIEELMEIFSEADIFIMYGQTEATSRLSYLPPHLLKKKMGSIGKGIPGTELKVIDKCGKEVLEGEIGEVVASGGNIMKGYFNDSVETNKVLKNGYLYTGDLAMVDSDGFIYLVSREKQIIKSAGNRISPREIEDTIVKIPYVVEAAVIGVEDDILGEAVKAFVVLNSSDYDIDNKYIVNFCKERLPSYKIPKYVEFLDCLPKNSSGKVMTTKLK